MTKGKDKTHECDMMGMMCCEKAMVFGGIILLLVDWVATKLLWDWIVPDVFSGIIAPTISWYTAFKIALVCTTLMMIKKKKMMHYKMMK